jgi:hypothetical protein
VFANRRKKTIWCQKMGSSDSEEFKEALVKPKQELERHDDEEEVQELPDKGQQDHDESQPIKHSRDNDDDDNEEEEQQQEGEDEEDEEEDEDEDEDEEESNVSIERYSVLFVERGLKA